MAQLPLQGPPNRENGWGGPLLFQLPSVSSQDGCNTISGEHEYNISTNRKRATEISIGLRSSVWAFSRPT